MRSKYSLGFALPLIAILLVGVEAGGQAGKRIVDLRAPVINDKEIKVECVHSTPHMVLRSKINETASFSITSDAKIFRTDCSKTADGGYSVPAGQRCTVFFRPEDAGKNITIVSADTPKTRYTFRGNWPIQACCRGKFSTKELDESMGPHSKEMSSDIIMADKNRVAKTGTLFRGYEITLYPERVDSHNREKDSANIFSQNFNWGGRQLTKGFCTTDDR